MERGLGPTPRYLSAFEGILCSMRMLLEALLYVVLVPAPADVAAC